MRGEQVPLTAEDEATRETLRAEYDDLENQYADQDEIPEGVEERFAEIEQTLGGMELRPLVFDPTEVACAGAFVSIDSEGELRVERGYVRPEDELPVPAELEADTPDNADADDVDSGAWPIRVESGGESAHGEPEPQAEPEEDEGMKPIPDRLLSELTAHRTLALRVALGEHRDVAFLAALHALCLRLFYLYGLDTCLDLDVKSVSFHAQAPGLNDTMLARTLAQRHQDWQAKLPRQAEELWDVLAGFRELSRGPCSPIACRCRSTPCSSPTAAGRAQSPMPARLRRRSISTWRRAGRRRSTTISAGSPRRASWPPCARPRLSTRRS